MVKCTNRSLKTPAQMDHKFMKSTNMKTIKTLRTLGQIITPKLWIFLTIIKKKFNVFI